MEEEIETVHHCSSDRQNKRNLNPKFSLNDQQKRIKVDPEILSAPSVQNTRRPRVSFILDKAPLKMATVGKTSVIMNVDDHSQILRKQKKNLADYDAAILHRSILSIIDSRIAKKSMVESIYVKVDNGVLFEVKPHARIPRMNKRFYGLMVDLLKKSRITNNDNEKLLSVIQEPITRHLPTNSRIIGLSYASGKMVNIEDYLASVDDDIHLVFVVGLMANGEIDKSYIDDFISVSELPLLSSGTIGGFICDALQNLWKL